MKKKVIIISILILVVSGIYLNRSYWHIYDKIHRMGLPASNSEQTYTIENLNENSKKILYVPLGDSLTAGVGVETYEQSYPYQFAQKISTDGFDVELKPFGIPGARGKEVIEHLLDGAIKTKPDLVTVLIGVNDVHGEIPKEEFVHNYEIILERLTKETQAQILLVNIPYIGAPTLILPPYNFYFDTQTQEFNQALLELSKKYNVKYVDLYTQTRKAANENSYYASDLFHPSVIGYTLWAQILYDSFNQ